MPTSSVSGTPLAGGSLSLHGTPVGPLGMLAGSQHLYFFEWTAASREGFARNRFVVKRIFALELMTSVTGTFLPTHRKAGPTRSPPCRNPSFRCPSGNGVKQVEVFFADAETYRKDRDSVLCFRNGITGRRKGCLELTDLGEDERLKNRRFRDEGESRTQKALGPTNQRASTDDLAFEVTSA